MFRSLAILISITLGAAGAFGQAKQNPADVPKPFVHPETKIEYSVNPSAPTTVVAKDAKGKLLWKTATTSALPQKVRAKAQLKKIEGSDANELTITVKSGEFECYIVINAKTGKIVRLYYPM